MDLSFENEKVKEFLVEIAKKRETINYGELCKAQYKELNFESFPDKTKLYKSLTEISKYEQKHDRHLLSVLVVDEITKIPGSGFFKLATDLNKYNGNESDEQRENFFKEERDNVYKIWENKSFRIR